VDTPDAGGPVPVAERVEFLTAVKWCLGWFGGSGGEALSDL